MLILCLLLRKGNQGEPVLNKNDLKGNQGEPVINKNDLLNK